MYRNRSKRSNASQWDILPVKVSAPFQSFRSRIRERPRVPLFISVGRVKSRYLTFRFNKSLLRGTIPSNARRAFVPNLASLAKHRACFVAITNGISSLRFHSNDPEWIIGFRRVAINCVIFHHGHAFLKRTNTDTNLFQRTCFCVSGRVTFQTEGKSMTKRKKQTGPPKNESQSDGTSVSNFIYSQLSIRYKDHFPLDFWNLEKKKKRKKHLGLLPLAMLRNPPRNGVYRTKPFCSERCRCVSVPVPLAHTYGCLNYTSIPWNNFPLTNRNLPGTVTSSENS